MTHTCNPCGGTFEKAQMSSKTRCKDCYNAYMRDYVRKNPEGYLMRAAKRRAQETNVPFNLKRGDLDIPKRCPILGLELSVFNGKHRDASYSLDKVVPELGYTAGNVRVISHLANRMKQNATPEQLLTFASNIKNYLT